MKYAISVRLNACSKEDNSALILIVYVFEDSNELEDYYIGITDAGETLPYNTDEVIVYT